MTLRDNIIFLLEKNKGQYVSGQEIAEKSNVSRSAVAKCISALKKDGYSINSVNNLGHCLDADCDILSEQGIHAHLDNEAEVIVFDLIDSTNNEAKRICANESNKDFIIAANGQTNGRGRRGKVFYSPALNGLYFSLVLHPDIELKDATGITAAAAVAVAQTIIETTKKDPKIKWVNDIFIENKKVCGILTEAVTDFETMNVQSVIVGIGVNLTTEIFPDEIKEIADSVGKIDRCEFIASVFAKIKALCEKLPDRSFMDDYRKLSLVIGKKVHFIQNGVSYIATAKDILNDGCLLVETEDGNEILLNSGEISIKI